MSIASLLQGNPVPPQPTGADTSANYPLWLQDYTYGLSNAATNLAQAPYSPFPGPQVATPSSATQQSWNMATGNVGNWQPNVNQAGALTQAAATPITGAQIQNYMNPYINTEVQGVTGALNQNLMQNVLPQLANNYVGFGQAGSPQQTQGINNAVYQNQVAVGNAVSPLYSQGYQGALGTALAEQQANRPVAHSSDSSARSRSN